MKFLKMFVLLGALAVPGWAQDSGDAPGEPYLAIGAAADQSQDLVVMDARAVAVAGGGWVHGGSACRASMQYSPRRVKTSVPRSIMPGRSSSWRACFGFFQAPLERGEGRRAGAKVDDQSGSAISR